MNHADTVLPTLQVTVLLIPPSHFRAAAKSPPIAYPSNGVVNSPARRLPRRIPTQRRCDMRYVRRLIATLTGCPIWCIAAATVAYARPDPGGGVIISTPADTAAAAAATTPLWQNFAMVALGVLLVLAVAGLVYSLMHRRSERSRTSAPSRGLHARPEPTVGAARPPLCMSRPCPMVALLDRPYV